MKIVVGLGNPENKYENNRHNIGFLAIHEIIKSHNLKTFKKFNSICSELHKNLILMMPQTYMNNSGIAMQECCRFYKIPVGNVIVIHDDVDLELSKIKIKIGGGNGGHNGLKSIDKHIGNEYLRVRLGVGKPQNPHISTADHVLQNFHTFEWPTVNNMLRFVCEHILEISQENLSPNDISRLLNVYSQMIITH